MNWRSPIPLPLFLLLGIAVILVIFAVSYIRARSSDRGTSYDDSPASEIGAIPER